MRKLVWAMAVAALGSATCPQAAPTKSLAAAQAVAGHADLVKFFADWRAFVQPDIRAGVPDYSAATMAKKAADLPSYRARLNAIATNGWPSADTNDWRLIEAEMNGFDFFLRVLKPWARDPGFYQNVFGEESDVPAHEANLPYKAIVKDQNGQPKANVSVTITAAVTSGTGGHTHNNGRPQGKLKVTTSTIKYGTETLAGKTDNNGEFSFNFGAEEASGDHTLNAVCTGCKDNAPGVTVYVRIPNLIRLGYDKTCTSFYCLRGGVTHLDNHYFDWRALIQIVKIAQDFQKRYGEVLKINDSSLVLGGLYDIKSLWTTSHKGHRKGVVVDINNYSARNLLFEKFVRGIKLNGISAIAKWEDSPPHYHLRLLGRDE